MALIASLKNAISVKTLDEAFMIVRRWQEQQTTTSRVIASILKHQAKTNWILINFDGKWCKASACQSKTKSGVRYNRFARLKFRLKRRL